MLLTIKDFIRTDEKVLISCDFKHSPKCKGEFMKVYKNVLKNQANNDGKDRCCFCFNSMTKTGSNNYNFKYDKDEEFFKEIDTELKAYLLGWIAGDGSVKKDGVYLSIHKCDIEILELFKSAFGHTREIFYQKRDNTANWRVNSKIIVDQCIKHLELDSVGKKSDKVKIPSYLSNELKWCFLRGMFDSDGHVASIYSKSTSPTASICSISKEMRLDIAALCDEFNIKYYYSEKNPNVTCCGHNAVKFMNKIYENSNFHLTRKHAMYKIWTTWSPGKGTAFNKRKIRTYYTPISEEHKEKIRESNRKRKKI